MSAGTLKDLLEGVHVVVVETTESKYRRRVYFSLPGAQKAADRAIMAGHAAHIILCTLQPADKALGKADAPA